MSKIKQLLPEVIEDLTPEEQLDMLYTNINIKSI